MPSPVTLCFIALGLVWTGAVSCRGLTTWRCRRGSDPMGHDSRIHARALSSSIAQARIDFDGQTPNPLRSAHSAFRHWMPSYLFTLARLWPRLSSNLNGKLAPGFRRVLSWGPRAARGLHMRVNMSGRNPYPLELNLVLKKASGRYATVPRAVPNAFAEPSVHGILSARAGNAKN
jgi:hypothetical protein